ncbi:putative E3 ubiquitin-protein ligase UBR7 isoform X2 [Stegostoma tigrinum]|uniref:putative E3 ubiquitin-protein ligase UBR7 isoform X2 n=1 Tax=Stegostoma tigrinum TaxID=3053191 RepID=UPI00287024BB|nr:putative E3 ubiquitin-protein ligase UBR7 isoform X2 [Stegostoma tigrinum]
MAANEGNHKRPLEEEDPIVSLADVLEEDEELENEACAVLGGSDSDRCSYSDGYVKRQALYACNTCTPKGGQPAGICLACSYKCHEGHELFELYTKRNFRCDCGNSKFNNLQCKFFSEKDKANYGNKYNDNFFGLYCTCKRPYPDPEDETPDEMIQCVVCEDWFHGRGASGDDAGCSVKEEDVLENTVCKLQQVKKKGELQRDCATYWPHNWRNKLCTCQSCLNLYNELEISFLLDEFDTVLAYETKGKTVEETEREKCDPLMTALSNMNRIQQVELIYEYNDLKTELKDYLKRFADEGKVVTSEDIQHFFEELQSKKRRRVDGMQYFCS